MANARKGGPERGDGDRPKWRVVLRRLNVVCVSS